MSTISCDLVVKNLPERAICYEMYGTDLLKWQTSKP